MIWWVLIKVVVSLIFSLLIFFWLFQAIKRWFSVHTNHEHAINLYHKANFRAFYYLAIEAPQHPPLSFRFMAGNIPLVEISQPAVTTRARVATNASSAAKTAGKADSKTHRPTTSTSGQQQVANNANKMVAKTGTIANLLGALAGLLGPFGGGIRRAQEKVRQAQVTGSKAAQAPTQAQQRMNVLKSESSKLGGGNQSAGKQSSSAAASAGGAKNSINSANMHTDSISNDEEGEDDPINLVQHPFGGFYCVQTVELDPEQTLPIKLIISTEARNRPMGSFPYKLHAQAIPLERLQEKIPVLSSSGVVYFAPVAAWRSSLPLFFSLLAGLFSLLLWFFLFAILWQ